MQLSAHTHYIEDDRAFNRLLEVLRRLGYKTQTSEQDVRHVNVEPAINALNLFNLERYQDVLRVILDDRSLIRDELQKSLQDMVAGQVQGEIAHPPTPSADTVTLAALYLQPLLRGFIAEARRAMSELNSQRSSGYEGQQQLEDFSVQALLRAYLPDYVRDIVQIYRVFHYQEMEKVAMQAPVMEKGMSPADKVMRLFHHYLMISGDGVKSLYERYLQPNTGFQGGRPAQYMEGGPAARDILLERRRQVEEKGYTLDRDVETRFLGDLASGGMAYLHACTDGGLLVVDQKESHEVPSSWPFADRYFKYGSPKRMLAKAGALLLAELEVLDYVMSGQAPDPVNYHFDLRHYEAYRGMIGAKLRLAESLLRSVYGVQY